MVTHTFPPLSIYWIFKLIFFCNDSYFCWKFNFVKVQNWFLWFYPKGTFRKINEFYTVSTHINLHSWLNHQCRKIWINLHFFGPKVHFLRLFEAFMGKIFNKPPPWNPHILINLRRFICVGTVYMQASVILRINVEVGT